MAIYHFSVKTVSRGQGRSAVAAAAYRAGEKLVDRQTGELYDYERRSGVLYSEVFLPDGGTMEREDLWNMAEAAEKRKDARVAREIVVALPHELNQEQQWRLVREYAKELSEREGWGVDAAMHAPGKEGDQRNVHAHLLCTTRTVERDSSSMPVMGSKTKEWDHYTQGPKKIASERSEWAMSQNFALGRHGIDSHVTCRSYQDQGLEIKPTQHLGVHAMAMERRGIQTERGDWNREVQQHNAQVIELAQVRERRADEQAWQKELSSWESLSSESLEKKLEALHPGSVSLLVERDPGVIEAAKTQDRYLKVAENYRNELRLNRKSAHNAEREWDSLKRQHPHKTFLAEKGLCWDRTINEALENRESFKSWVNQTIDKAIEAEDKLMQASSDYHSAWDSARYEKEAEYSKRIERYEEAYPLLAQAKDREHRAEIEALYGKPYESMYQEVDKIRWRPFESREHGLSKLGKGLEHSERWSRHLSSQESSAKYLYERVKDEREAWEKRHPVQSFMHRNGVLENKELKALYQQEAWGKKSMEVSDYSGRCARERLWKREEERDRERGRSKPEREKAQEMEKRFKRSFEIVRERRQEREPKQHQLMLERVRVREREQYRGMSL